MLCHRGRSNTRRGQRYPPSSAYASSHRLTISVTDRWERVRPLPLNVTLLGFKPERLCVRTYIIDVLVIVSDIVELNFVVVSGSERIRLVDFGLREKQRGGKKPREWRSISSASLWDGREVQDDGYRVLEALRTPSDSEPRQRCTSKWRLLSCPEKKKKKPMNQRWCGSGCIQDTNQIYSRLKTIRT